MKSRTLAIIGLILASHWMPVAVARAQVGTGLSVTPSCTPFAAEGGAVQCNITVKNANVSGVAIDTLGIRSAFPRGATGTCGCPAGSPASCQLLPQVLRCCGDSDCISPQVCTGAIAPQCHVAPGAAVPGAPG